MLVTPGDPGTGSPSTPVRQLRQAMNVSRWIHLPLGGVPLEPGRGVRRAAAPQSGGLPLGLHVYEGHPEVVFHWVEGGVRHRLYLRVDPDETFTLEIGTVWHPEQPDPPAVLFGRAGRLQG